MRFHRQGPPPPLFICIYFFAVVMHPFCSEQLCISRHYKDCLEPHIPRTLDRHAGPEQHVEVDR